VAKEDQKVNKPCLTPLPLIVCRPVFGYRGVDWCIYRLQSASLNPTASFGDRRHRTVFRYLFLLFGADDLFCICSLRGVRYLEYNYPHEEDAYECRFRIDDHMPALRPPRD